MVYLAKYFKEKKISSLKKISQEEEIPFDFLDKIILELEKEGLVKAKKGAGGGYFLARPPEKITAGKIVEILEGGTAPVNCMFCQRARKCLTKKVWKKIQDSVDSALNSITLADLSLKMKK